MGEHSAEYDSASSGYKSEALFRLGDECESRSSFVERDPTRDAN